MKRDVESCYDFNARRAFKAIDELNYNYLNEANIKVFLRKMGHQVIRKELTAIIRRFDLDGDSKISFQEFNEGIRIVNPEIIPQREKESVIKSPVK